MRANMFIALSVCSDIVFYITYVDTDLQVVGLDASVGVECFTNDLHGVNREILVVPRRIIKVSERSLEKCFALEKSILVGCLPTDTGSARRLAKIHRLSVVVVTPTSIKVVNESQVNFMHQSGGRNKYIEVHVHPFVDIFTTSNLSISAEKSLYMLGNIIERALKLDVGIVLSTASNERRKLLSLTHLDIILFYIGFTKRERRLIMEVYPTELLLTWLNYR
ncbi:MAG: hypothetical protein N3E36_06915 [Sulfolobales archaeon]|nr:hypothetical protein [Ignisphaera sp.]MCX8199725.1 hypothetical protein [Sulfolobales archaeon]MDW8085856.1 hypothetical protein [Ignisphaera sp.]